MKYKKCPVACIVVAVILTDLSLIFYLAVIADMTFDHSLEGFRMNITNQSGGSNNKSHVATLSPSVEDTTYVFRPPASFAEYFESHRYNFFACQLDFIVLSFLRALTLASTLFILLYFDSLKAIQWILKCETLIICIFLSTLVYGPIKLLALSELYPDFSVVALFWGTFVANVVFSVVGAVLCACIMPKCEVSADKSIKSSESDRQAAGTVVGPIKKVGGAPATLSASTTEVKVREELDESEPLVEENTSSSDEHRRSKKRDRRTMDLEDGRIGGGKTNKACHDRKTSSGSRRLSDDSLENLRMMQKQQETAEQERLKKEEEAQLGRVASTALMLRLLKYCKEEWLLYTLGFIFLLGYSCARIVIPLFTGQVVADTLIHKSSERLTKSATTMIGILLISAVLSGLRAACFMYAIAKVNMKIRSELFLSLVRQEIGFFDVTKTGEITSRLTSDCQVMSDTVATNVNLFLRSFIMMIGSIVMMLTLSWRLTLLIFVVLPIIVLVSKVYGTYYDKLAQQGQDAIARSNEVAEEVLSSMRTVRSFANELGESKRYDQKLMEALRIGKKKSLAYMGYTWISELADLIILACLCWYGGHLVLTGRMNSEVLVSYFLYQLQLADCLISMGSVYTGLMQAVGASRKVFEFIDRKPKIRYDGSVESSQFKGRIEFRNVTFSYPSRPGITVLKDISFTVEPGECCALVGPSGGGKSSCIGLLEYFYEPLGGQVLIDSIPVGHYEHAFYHRKVSLVGQEPVLYAKSVRDNIAYGLEQDEVTDNDIVRSSKLANAHRFVVALSNGYSTDVGEKGLQLSGGQKQRVAIARAIVRKPAILLLDEATSALDAESEHLVQKALNENLAGYTVVLIAHRLSTVQRANKIVVIENGTVVQQGTHDQLIRIDGLYKNLVQRQMLGEISTRRGSTQGSITSDHSSSRP